MSKMRGDSNLGSILNALAVYWSLPGPSLGRSVCISKKMSLGIATAIQNGGHSRLLRQFLAKDATSRNIHHTNGLRHAVIQPGQGW